MAKRRRGRPTAAGVRWTPQTHEAAAAALAAAPAAAARPCRPFRRRPSRRCRAGQPNWRTVPRAARRRGGCAGAARRWSRLGSWRPNRRWRLPSWHAAMGSAHACHGRFRADFAVRPSRSRGPACAVAAGSALATTRRANVRWKSGRRRRRRRAAATPRRCRRHRAHLTWRGIVLPGMRTNHRVGAAVPSTQAPSATPASQRRCRCCRIAPRPGLRPARGTRLPRAAAPSRQHEGRACRKTGNARAERRTVHCQAVNQSAPA
mmetsp:Transcript_40643/g.121236  ORF Transcript_40643/g.121236 Transcript_40643/m.121236 type:complete len:262 (+) Transcript_40643:1406-2191(+)